MSIAFGALRTAMFAWIGTVGVTVDDVFTALPVSMANEAKAADFINPIVGAKAFLNVIGVRTLGEDEVRKIDAESDDLPVLLPKACGGRLVTVSCRVDSYTAEPGSSAIEWAEKARARLRLPRARDIFTAAGIAVVEAAPLVDVTNKLDGRIFGRVSFDVVFGMAAIDQEIAENALDTIGSVAIASETIDDVDGEPTEIQADITVTEDDET